MTHKVEISVECAEFLFKEHQLLSVLLTKVNRMPRLGKEAEVAFSRLQPYSRFQSMTFFAELGTAIETVHPSERLF